MLLFIGTQEVFVLLIFVVMFFGAKRIPEIARGLGQGIKYVRNATNELKQEITQSADQNEDVKDAKDALTEGKQALDDLKDSVRRSTRL
ncbi:MAG: twin-arginine translocase TatA/TatE family subunit [Flavobacteriia bacterium]|nr:twin-arginine translocase TatA/TatE family subunit [Flavobacteriia bacterium]